MITLVVPATDRTRIQSTLSASAGTGDRHDISGPLVGILVRFCCAMFLCSDVLFIPPLTLIRGFECAL